MQLHLQNMETLKSKYNIIATILFILIIAVAHLSAAKNYYWTRNTISDLGAQGYSRKYIMQFGFLAFGLILTSGIVGNGFAWRTAPIFIYGLCVALTGVFCTKPFFYVANYSEMQATVHSLLAQIAGIMFTIGIMMQLFYVKEASEKGIHLVFLLLVLGLSVSFGLVRNYQGLVQRLLYLVSFIWLIRFYKP
jgi:hypothetical membrane protein